MIEYWNGDIEADGLLDTVTKMHIANFKHSKTKEEVYFYHGQEKELQSFLSNAGMLAMHNGIAYDREALNKLGVKCDNFIIDTLLLSQYLYPKRVKHGLKSYGEEYGTLKEEVADDEWKGENMSPEEHAALMKARVTSDVVIQERLTNQILRDLNLLYDGDWPKIMDVLKYFHYRGEKEVLKARQRWRFDKKQADIYLAEWEKQLGIKTVELMRVMPAKPVEEVKVRPKKYFKKDGSLTAAANKWLDLCEFWGKNPEDTNITIYPYHKLPQPHYVPEVKEWLFSLGWEPDIYEFKRNKKTGETKNVPQITIKDGDDAGELCKSIIKLSEKVPELSALLGYSVLKHRIGFIKAMIECCSEDGYLIAEIDNFTNTLRSKHKRPLANIPSVRKPMGAEIRGLLIADDGYELIGSDMSSLEDKTKHHYMWPIDPEAVKRQQRPGFDPHVNIALLAGLLTQKEVDFFKEMKKANPHDAEVIRIGLIRQVGKGGNYSCQYGAQPPTVARTCGVELSVGKKVFDAYWKENKAIPIIAKSTKVKRKVLGVDWQLNPINGMWYWLKKDADRFSTLVQGTGAFFFDCWIMELIRIFKERWGRNIPLCGDYHDEIILQVKKGYRELFTEVLNEGIEAVNKKFKLNVDLAIGIDFGNNYAEIH